MSANLSLVVQTTQRNSYILTLQGIGYRLAQRCLSNSRRTIQTQDGRLQVTTQRQYGDILQDALLHLLHTIVVAVQNLLGTLQVEVVLRIFTPRQPHQRLQIGQLNVEVGRVLVHLIQLLQFLIEVLLYLLRPQLFLGLLQQVLLLGRTLVAHLGLQVLDLLLQEVVTLLFVDIVTCLVADVQLQGLKVYLAIDNAHHVEQTLLNTVYL